MSAVYGLTPFLIDKVLAVGFLLGCLIAPFVRAGERRR